MVRWLDVWVVRSKPHAGGYLERYGFVSGTQGRVSLISFVLACWAIPQAQLVEGRACRGYTSNGCNRVFNRKWPLSIVPFAEIWNGSSCHEACTSRFAHFLSFALPGQSAMQLSISPVDEEDVHWAHFYALYSFLMRIFGSFWLFLPLQDEFLAVKESCLEETPLTTLRSRTNWSCECRIMKIRSGQTAVNLGHECKML